MQNLPCGICPLGAGRGDDLQFDQRGRVEYFEVYAPGAAYWLLPSVAQLQPAAGTTSEERETITAGSTWEICASVRSSSYADTKIVGRPTTIGIQMNSGKWRPCGLGAWLTQPTNAQFPIESNVPVALRLSGREKGVLVNSKGRKWTSSAPTGLIAVVDVTPVFCWTESGNSVSTTYRTPAGARFYYLKGSCTVPGKEYQFHFVPWVSDDGKPCMKDLVSGKQIASAVMERLTVGPECAADDWSPIPESAWG